MDIRISAPIELTDEGQVLAPFVDQAVRWGITLRRDGDRAYMTGFTDVTSDRGLNVATLNQLLAVPGLEVEGYPVWAKITDHLETVVPAEVIIPTKVGGDRKFKEMPGYHVNGDDHYCRLTYPVGFGANGSGTSAFNGSDLKSVIDLIGVDNVLTELPVVEVEE